MVQFPNFYSHAILVAKSPGWVDVLMSLGRGAVWFYGPEWEEGRMTLMGYKEAPT